MPKQLVKCESCKRPFWSSTRKSFILIAKKEFEEDGKVKIARIVKGAFLKRPMAEKQQGILEKEYKKTGEYEEVVIDVQHTIKNLECQRCRNRRLQIQNKLHRQQLKGKKPAKERGVREIPKEDVARLLRRQVQYKIIRDYQETKAKEKRKKKNVKTPRKSLDGKSAVDK